MESCDTLTDGAMTTGAAHLRHCVVQKHTPHTGRNLDCAAWIVLVLALLTVPCLVVLNVENDHSPFITTYEPNRTIALTRAISTPFVAGVFNLASERLARYIPPLGPSPVGQHRPLLGQRTVVAVALSVAFSFREVVEYGVSPQHPWALRRWDEVFAGLLVVLAWKCVDTVTDWIKECALADEAANESAPVRRWREIMQEAASSGRADKDLLYKHDSPEKNDAFHLLLMMTDVIGFSCKALAALLFICTLLDLDRLVHMLLASTALAGVVASFVTIFQMFPNLN